jgi:hypothetical protein
MNEQTIHHRSHSMQTKFIRQPWAFDSNYLRVEALDDESRPLGYVFFVRRQAVIQQRERAEGTSAWSFPAYARNILLALMGKQPALESLS